jgi:hypothetical protein
MTTHHAPITLSDGTKCYSGPDCKRHGVRKASLFTSMKDVFARAEKELPRVVLSSEATERGFGESARAHFAALTPGEKRSVHEYSDRAGSLYVNRLLGSRTPVESMPIPVRVMVENLDSGLSKAPSASTPRTVYRGVKALPEGWQDLKAGDTVTELSYTSTSLSAIAALEFADKDNPVLIQLTTSKGAPVMVHENEYEMLLPRNETYEVVSVVRNQNVEAQEPAYSPEHPSSRVMKRSNVLLITLRAV